MKKLIKVLKVIAVILGVVLLVKFAFIFHATSDGTKPPQPTPDTVVESDILWNEVNKWRIRNERVPFEKDKLLCLIAEVRLEDIQENGFNHDLFSTRARSTFGDRWYFVGENLAREIYDERVIVDRWEDSTGHRENLIERSFKKSCIATDGNYVVQVYGTY